MEYVPIDEPKQLGPYARYKQRVQPNGASVAQYVPITEPQELGPYASSAAQEPRTSPWDAFKRGAASGFSFGFDDELQARLASDGMTYEDAVAKIRAEKDKLYSEHPISYITGGLLGAAGQLAAFRGLGAVAARAGAAGLESNAAMRLLGAAVGSTGAAPSMGQLAKVGAISGAAHGLGSGEDLESRAFGAGVGAATGAALTPAVSVLGGALGKGISGIASSLKGAPDKSGIPGRSMQRAAKYLVDSGVEAEPGGIGRALEQYGPGATLRDIPGQLGEKVKSYARSNVNVQKTLSEAGEKRIAGESASVSQAIGDNLKLPIDIDQMISSNQYKDLLDTAVKNNSIALYEQGRNTPIKNVQEVVDLAKYHPQLGMLLNRVSFFERKAKNLEPSAPITLTEGILHNVQDALDDLAQNKPYQEMQYINSIRQKILDILDNNNPNYKIARQEYSTFKHAREALRKGEKAANPSTSYSDIKYEFNNLKTPDEKLAYKIGFRSAFQEKIHTAVDEAIKANRQISPNVTKMKLKELFGEEASEGLRKRINEITEQGIVARSVPKFKGKPDIAMRFGVTDLPQGKYGLINKTFQIIDDIISPDVSAQEGLAKLATLPDGSLASQDIIRTIEHFMKLRKEGLMREDQMRLFFAQIGRLAGTAAPNLELGGRNIGEGMYED